MPNSLDSSARVMHAAVYPAPENSMPTTPEAKGIPGHGTQSLLIDCIHDHLDQERPLNTPTTSIEKLREKIRAYLSPLDHRSDGTSKTRFTSVTAKPDGGFALQLEKNRTVERSRDEIELHILLQSQVRLAEGEPVDYWDALTPACLAGLSAPEQHPEPGPAVDHLKLDKPYGGLTRYFNEQSIDLQAIANRLSSVGSHTIKRISPDRNNCWWRGGILAGLFQQDPGKLQATLTERLAGDYPGDRAEDIADFCNMGAAARAGKLANIVSNDNLLKLDSDSDANAVAGEALCKRIVRKILLSAGQSARVVDAAIDHPTINGNNNLIQLLLKELECDYACVRYDVVDGVQKIQGMEIGAQPESGLAKLIDNPDSPPSADALFDALEKQGVPILINGSLHFNIAFANSVISPERDRQSGQA